MTSRLAPCFLAACGEWIVEGRGAGEMDWEDGALIQAAAPGGPSPQLRGRLL